MSWHFSQALVAEFLGGGSSDGKPSAPSSATLTQGMCWSHDKTTDALPRSRSGMTYAPSKATLGADLLTWYRAASRVRTYQAQARAQESAALAVDYGKKWRELLVRFDPLTSGWKTHQCLFPEVLPSSSLTLPRWGIMRDGELWERTTPARLISETGFGYWPTPAARDCKGANSQAHCESHGTGRKHMDQLANAVAFPHLRFATPQSRDFRTGQRSRWENPEKTKNLNDQIGGQLNPIWVEWLMGWPIGWTDCDASATDKFRLWCNSHGNF